MNFCPNCGAKLAGPNERACAACGQPLAFMPVPPPAEAARETAPPWEAPMQAAPETRPDALPSLLNAAENSAEPGEAAPAQAGTSPAAERTGSFAPQGSTIGQDGRAAFTAEPMREAIDERGPPPRAGADALAAEVPARDFFAAAGTPAAPESEDAFAPLPLSGTSPGVELFAGEEALGFEPRRGEAPPAEAFEAESPARQISQKIQQQLPQQQVYRQQAGSVSLFDGEDPWTAPAQPPASARQPAREVLDGGRARRQKPPPRQRREEERGAVLPPPQAPRRAGTPPPPLPLPEPPRGRSFLGQLFTVLGVLILFAALGVGATLVILWYQNRPEKAVNDFMAAVAAGDTETLAEITTINGAAENDAGWAAFLAMFNGEQRQVAFNTLKNQLTAQAKGSAAVPEYPAVSLESRPFILFIEKHSVSLSGVQLLAPGAPDGTKVRLNGVEYAGEAADGGVLYGGLMPGFYQCLLIPPGADPTTIVSVEQELFNTAAPNVLGQGTSSSGATLRIANCAGEVTAVTVNDLPVPERPQDGVLTLANVALGSVIRIEATVGGQALVSSVTFADAAVTDLRFDNYTEAAAPPPASSASLPPQEETEALKAARALTAEQINGYLATVYQSYLEAINKQDTALLAGLTSAARTALAGRVVSDNNKANQFVYVSAASDAATLRPSDANGVPTVTVEAAFAYRYQPRDQAGATLQDGGNRQRVTLVLQEGQWLVSEMTMI